MYPTVVIVLIETHRSMTDLCQVQVSSSRLPSWQSGESGSEASNRLPFTVETRKKVVIDKESPYERSCTSQVEDGETT